MKVGDIVKVLYDTWGGRAGDEGTIFGELDYGYFDVRFTGGRSTALRSDFIEVISTPPAPSDPWAVAIQAADEAECIGPHFVAAEAALRNVEALQALGWKTEVIWECDTRDPDRLTGVLDKLSENLQAKRNHESELRPIVRSGQMVQGLIDCTP
jgi:hypothetical protein